MKSYLQKPTRKLYLFFLKKIPKCSKKVRNILVFSRIRYSQVICTLHNRFSYMLLLKVVLKFIMFFQSEVFDVTSSEYHEASGFIYELCIYFYNLFLQFTILHLFTILVRHFFLTLCSLHFLEKLIAVIAIVLFIKRSVYVTSFHFSLLNILAV